MGINFFRGTEEKKIQNQKSDSETGSWNLTFVNGFRRRGTTADWNV